MVFSDVFSYLQCFQPGGSTVQAATVSDFIASTPSPRIKYPPRNRGLVGIEIYLELLGVSIFWGKGFFGLSMINYT